MHTLTAAFSNSYVLKKLYKKIASIRFSQIFYSKTSKEDYILVMDMEFATSFMMKS